MRFMFKPITNIDLRPLTLAEKREGAGPEVAFDNNDGIILVGVSWVRVRVGQLITMLPYGPGSVTAFHFTVQTDRL